METALFIIFSVFCAIGFLYVIMLISEWFVFGDRETVVRAKVEVHVQGGGMFCAGLARGLIEFMSRIRTGQGRPEIGIVDDGLTDRNRQELEDITDGLDFVCLEDGTRCRQEVENGTGENLA